MPCDEMEPERTCIDCGERKTTEDFQGQSYICHVCQGEQIS